MSLKYLLTVTAIMATSVSIAAPVEYHLNPGHIQALFAIDHYGFSKTLGLFTKISGALLFDEQNVENSTVRLSIDPNSVYTGDEERDKALRGADFFDAQKNPEIRFVSTRVTKAAEGMLTVAGNLTIRGRTKPVTFSAKLNKSGQNPFDPTPLLGYTASGWIKRSDYGITMYLPGLSDRVDLTFDLEFGGPGKK
jgi:polyisoprenoid-binding protein YceI